MRALIVEDESRIAAFLKRGLEEHTYAVDLAADGDEGYEWARNFQYDVIVLDVLLPKLNGIELCKRLRRDGNQASIIMLTAKHTVQDRITGLDAGADDYLVKPFAFGELLARLRAVHRRADNQTRTTTLTVADLTLDLVGHVASRGGRAIELSAKEFALLEMLMRHPNQVLTRTLIAEHVWGYDFYNQSNVVDVYIRYLRRKIDDPFERKLIQTVRGMGYKLTDDDIV